MTGLWVLELWELSIVAICLIIVAAACIEAIGERRKIIKSGINHGATNFANAAVKMRLYKLGLALGVFLWSVDSLVLMQSPLAYPTRFVVYGFVRMLFAFFTVGIVLTNRRIYHELVKEARQEK